jgi:hypothetical protein
LADTYYEPLDEEDIADYKAALESMEKEQTMQVAALCVMSAGKINSP